MKEFSWLIPFFPFLAGLFIIFITHKIRSLSAFTSIGGTAIAAIYSFILLFNQIANPKEVFESSFNWIQIGDFHLDIGILLDPLAIIMLALICTVSLLVQIYSHGYMQTDKNYARFFSFLALFTASMLALVISPNLFQVYIFWELVGLFSYLLIGFWHKKETAANASFKAFIINRVGDCGLLAGILLLAFITQSLWPEQGFLAFSALPKVLNELQQNNHFLLEGFLSLTVIGVLILMGPMAKSAQFPLHTWLPDAMEGPTPISALIHAATMVAAGVYLLARLFPFYSIVPHGLEIIALIGAFTAIFSALIALTQNDIKKALAYSTCSQLGYMVMCIGLGSWVGAIFHLVTHAFFKALLFLGAGSVIHSCHHEQDMNKLGGLASKMPITHATFLLATLAISGIPPLAGFWSKEQIIKAAWEAGPANLTFILAIITTLLTALYMFRIYFKTFGGQYKGDSHDLPHESQKSMTIPLIILAIPTCLIGLIGTPLNILGGNHFAKFLQPLNSENHLHSGGFEIFMEPSAILALLFSIIGVFLSVSIYKNHFPVNKSFKESMPWFYQLSVNKFYIDEIYMFAWNKCLSPLIGIIYLIFDKTLLQDFLPKFTKYKMQFGTWFMSRSAQSGQIQVYLNVFLFSLIVIIFFFIIPVFDTASQIN